MTPISQHFWLMDFGTTKFEHEFDIAGVKVWIFSHVRLKVNIPLPLLNLMCYDQRCISVEGLPRAGSVSRSLSRDQSNWTGEETGEWLDSNRCWTVIEYSTIRVWNEESTWSNIALHDISNVRITEASRLDFNASWRACLPTFFCLSLETNNQLEVWLWRECSGEHVSKVATHGHAGRGPRGAIGWKGDLAQVHYVQDQEAALAGGFLGCCGYPAAKGKAILCVEEWVSSL